MNETGKPRSRWLSPTLWTLAILAGIFLLVAYWPKETSAASSGNAIVAAPTVAASDSQITASPDPRIDELVVPEWY